MHQSGLGGLIIDCRTDDLDGEAHFWSKALGYELQTVEHPSRVHLDIKTDDVEAEVHRLERLGATRVKKVKHWWVLEAPSGHRFCVIPLHPGQNVGRLNRWDGDA